MLHWVSKPWYFLNFFKVEIIEEQEILKIPFLLFELTINGSNSSEDSFPLRIAFFILLTKMLHFSTKCSKSSLFWFYLLQLLTTCSKTEKYESIILNIFWIWASNIYLVSILNINHSNILKWLSIVDIFSLLLLSSSSITTIFTGKLSTFSSFINYFMFYLLSLSFHFE